MAVAPPEIIDGLGIGLRWIVEACRVGGGTPGAALAAGGRCLSGDLPGFLPEPVQDDLVREGLLVDGDDGRCGLVLTCRAFNGLVSILPADQEVGPDFVHVNADTTWLLKLAWEHASSGAYAAELGTGNGIVAATLAARYRRVVATDLPGPWMRYAQLTLAANAGRGRPSMVMACDVGSALRRGAFDMVVANAPWSPAAPVEPETGRTLTFMAGGPTGTELPSRFLLEAGELLAPGGTAVVLCLDPVFDDNVRPLEPTLVALQADQHTVDLVESAVFGTDRVTDGLRRRLPNLTSARHVAVVLRAPVS